MALGLEDVLLASRGYCPGRPAEARPTLRDLLGSTHELAHERLRQLALMKLPQLDDLIVRTTSLQRVLTVCSRYT